MLIEQIAITLLGFGVGLLVNILARWLPQLSPTYQEKKNAATSETSVDPSTRAIHVRQIIVLALTVASSLYLWNQDQRQGAFATTLTYVAIFLLISVIDFEYLIVPDVLIVPAVVFAIFEILFTRRISFIDGLAGYAAAQIILAGVYLGARLYLALINWRRSEEARISEVPFGFGDITLASFCGLVIGLVNVYVFVILMVILGALTAIVMTLVRLVVHRTLRAHSVIPYGPAIVASAGLIMIWGPRVATILLGGT